MSASAIRISSPEELPRAAAVLTRHGEELDRIGKAISVASRRHRDRARDAVTQLQGRVEAARRALQRALEEDGDVPVARARLDAATKHLADGMAAQRRIDEVLAELEQRCGQHVPAGRDLAEKGWRGLRRFWERLDKASATFAAAVARHRAQPGVSDPRRIVGGRSGGHGAGGHGAGGHGPGTHGPGGGTDGPDLLGELEERVLDHVRDEIVDAVQEEVTDIVVEGMRCHYPSVGATDRVLVPLEDLMDPDPVTGPGSFEKVPLADMIEGLRVLEEQVLPAVRQGCGSDDMRRRDVAAGTSDSPTSLLRVYEAFFGSEEHAVRATRRPDGRVRLDAGRHRFFAAKRRHLDVLPVLLREDR